LDRTAEEILVAGENVIVELDKKGRIMGIEVWDASKKGLKRAKKSCVLVQKQQDRRKLSHNVPL
jgi:uncharacterized protein YuzE